MQDFNYCFLEESMNSTKKYLKENSFSQLVNKPTHIEGNLLDQAHVKQSTAHTTRALPLLSRRYVIKYDYKYNLFTNIYIFYVVNKIENC